MISLRAYRQSDREGVKACFIELQEFEQKIESNRRSGGPIFTKYFRGIQNSCKKKQGKIFVAHDGKSVVGYTCVWIERRPELVFKTLTDYAWVQDLVVLPAFRKKGLGKALLQMAEKHSASRGIRTLILCVLAGNTAAL